MVARLGPALVSLILLGCSGGSASTGAEHEPPVEDAAPVDAPSASASQTPAPKAEPEPEPDPAVELAQRLDARLAQGFDRRAATTVAGDQLEWWFNADEFGAVVLVARDRDGALLAYEEAQLSSSARPFFAGQRYLAFGAHDPDGAVHSGLLIVWDAETDRFRRFEAPIREVHGDIAIHDGKLYLGACKTPSPLGFIDLESGEGKAFKEPGLQSPAFYLDGNDLVIQTRVQSKNKPWFTVQGGELVEREQRTGEALVSLEQPFASIAVTP